MIPLLSSMVKNDVLYVLRNFKVLRKYANYRVSMYFTQTEFTFGLTKIINAHLVTWWLYMKNSN